MQQSELCAQHAQHVSWSALLVAFHLLCNIVRRHKQIDAQILVFVQYPSPPVRLLARLHVF